MVVMVKWISSNQPRSDVITTIAWERAKTFLGENHPPWMFPVLGAGRGIGQRGLRVRKVIVSNLSLSGHRFPRLPGRAENSFNQDPQIGLGAPGLRPPARGACMGAPKKEGESWAVELNGRYSPG